jgi:hypothetical protein
MSAAGNSQATPQATPQANPVHDAYSFIKSTEGPLTDQDLNAYQTVNAVENSKIKLNTVLDLWKTQTKTDIELRKRFAYYVLAALFIELLCGNAIMFLIGFGLLDIKEWVANVFYVGMYGQIISITLYVIRYLFPAPKKDPQSALFELVDKL